MQEYDYIDHIKSPEDVKRLAPSEIPALEEEIRRFLIDKVTRNGGHLASNLGVVELAVALHRAFDSPTDRIIWDVGHQSYVHKILTGRAAEFDTLRTPGGLSGFPVRRESAHDPFGTGHSSTSVSAALGFAEANAMAGRKEYTIAVVGDGAFTGGMIHEALNNCRRDLRLIIVLNDNEMSISRNIGLFARYLSRIRLSGRYGATKDKTKSILGHVPLLGRALTRAISALKGWLKKRVYHNNYFEDLGFVYLGPVDGHNEAAMERIFREAKKRGCAAVIHVHTQKGKGLEDAERDPTAFHGVAPAKAGDGKSVPAAKGSFHAALAEALCTLAKEDSSVCAVTAAMGEGTGLVAFEETYPERYFDVGIAEEHALTFSAGLAAAGLKPYFAVYSTFLQRAYDNLLHDVALQGLPVRILVDRAGLAEADGATHHGIFDVAFASHVPGVEILSPATYGSLRAMLRASLQAEHPLIIRYPNAAEDERVERLFYPKGDFEGYGVRALGVAAPEAVLIAYGSVLPSALDALLMLGEKGVRVEMILLERPAPYADAAKAILPLLPDGVPVFFAEEGIRAGGAGMLLGDALAEQDEAFHRRHTYDVIAIDGHFAVPDAPRPLREYCRIDGKSIAVRIASTLARAAMTKKKGK